MTRALSLGSSVVSSLHGISYKYIGDQVMTKNKKLTEKENIPFLHDRTDRLSSLASHPTYWSVVLCCPLVAAAYFSKTGKVCREKMWFFQGNSIAHSGLWNMLSCAVSVLKIFGSSWRSSPWSYIVMWESWFSGFFIRVCSNHGVKRSLENKLWRLGSLGSGNSIFQVPISKKPCVFMRLMFCECSEHSVAGVFFFS